MKNRSVYSLKRLMAQNSSDYLTAWVFTICLRDDLYQIAEELQHEHSCHNGYYYYFLNLVFFSFFFPSQKFIAACF
jgi:hypothetical protein